MEYLEYDSYKAHRWVLRQESPVVEIPMKYAELFAELYPDLNAKYDFIQVSRNQFVPNSLWDALKTLAQYEGSRQVLYDLVADIMSKKKRSDVNLSNVNIQKVKQELRQNLIESIDTRSLLYQFLKSEDVIAILNRYPQLNELDKAILRSIYKAIERYDVQKTKRLGLPINKTIMKALVVDNKIRRIWIRKLRNIIPGELTNEEMRQIELITAASLKREVSQRGILEVPTIFADIGYELPANEMLVQPWEATRRLFAQVLSGKLSSKMWEKIKADVRKKGTSTLSEYKQIVPDKASPLVLRRLLDISFENKKDPVTVLTMRDINAIYAANVYVDNMRNFVRNMRNGKFAERVDAMFEPQRVTDLYYDQMDIKKKTPYQTGGQEEDAGLLSMLMDLVEFGRDLFTNKVNAGICRVCSKPGVEFKCACSNEVLLCSMNCLKKHIDE